VIRDPKDAIVSAYFSHRNTHWFPDYNDWQRHQERLRRLSFDDGLMAEIEFSHRYLNQLASWDFDTYSS
jgi:hypothetical protein